MRRYELPAAFYDDHAARDCESGVVVRRKARTVVVDLDVIAWLDLRSDADYYSNPATAADMADCSGMGAYGLARSAAATLRRLDADPYTDAEQAAGHDAWKQRQAEQAAADAAANERWRVEYRQREAERAAERAAHPRITAEYEGRAGTVIGVSTDAPLQVGARISVWIASEQRHRHYTVLTLGERDRGWKHDATVDHDGKTLAIRIERC